MFEKPRPSIPHDAKSQQDGKARIRRATLPPLHQQRSRLAAGKPVRWGPGRFESRRRGGCHQSSALGGYQGKKKLPAQMKFAQQMELHLLLKVGPRPCICRTLSHSSCRPATPNACTLSVNADFCAAILSPRLEVRRQCAHVVLDRPCFESPSLRAPAIQKSRAWAQLAWVNGIASFAGEPELEGEVVLKVRMPACPITECPDEGCGVPQSSAEVPVTWPSEATKVSISPRGRPSPTKKNRQGENSRGWQSGGGSGGSGAWVHSGSTCAKASADLRDQQGPQNLQFRCGHPSEQVICRFANTRQTYEVT